MDAPEFIRKWSRSTGSERADSQPHFLDLCALLGHGTPADLDPKHEWFTFEKGAPKQSGGDGFADVWKKGFFAWEYKGKHKDLDAAYAQLLQYREALENPPLLVVSDIDSIIVRTNFNNTPTKVYIVPLLQMDQQRNLDLLRDVFFHPDRLNPGRSRQEVTTDAAERIGEIALSMRVRGLDPQAVAKFLDRIVFCLFAEDIDLLPPELFSRMVEANQGQPAAFREKVERLFEAMANGGGFGEHTILRFNGNLFVDSPVLEMTEAELDRLYYASNKLEWDAVDPSIFGTLFERGMDPDKRAQIGAHYTSREDIETLVKPVVMAPLDREWEEIKKTVENLLATGRKDGAQPKKALTQGQRTKARDESERLVRRFHERLTQLKVLDPACGSGNFLYVTLQKLKDLEKAVIIFAQDKGPWPVDQRVGPWQLYGIEINPYAYELAQMVVWIGYIQWLRCNGFQIEHDPVLRPMTGNFQNEDAILDRRDPDHPKEPDWPNVDCIVGNPPFLGGKLMRAGLGDEYVDNLFQEWKGRVPHEADLCCYWFEKARAHMAAGECERAGLLATQGIRGGANRAVLDRIQETASMFFAESDRPWVLDGANVHVSMVAFLGGPLYDPAILDGKRVSSINANLTATADTTKAERLAENVGMSFMGDTKGGAFETTDQSARSLLEQPNPHGRPNSDVVVPWVNGRDITQRGRMAWIVDFALEATEAQASLYEVPFEFVVSRVKATRERNKRERYRELWWLHVEARPGMRGALGQLPRYIGTPNVTKHRLFGWLEEPVLPDHQLIAFARSDDYFFGVLHSRLHEVWARAQGTQLRERESGFRYTPTTCFETFPFPWPPGQEPASDPLVQAIAEAARKLNEYRENWLNPPAWTKTEVLEFPGSVDGPWARYVHDANDGGIGTVRYARVVDNGVMPSQLKRRTLTNLYNDMPTWLRNAHVKLNAAVCAAYAATTGDAAWKPDMSDEQILEKLLALNRARA